MPFPLKKVLALKAALLAEDANVFVSNTDAEILAWLRGSTAGTSNPVEWPQFMQWLTNTGKLETLQIESTGNGSAAVRLGALTMLVFVNSGQDVPLQSQDLRDVFAPMGGGVIFTNGEVQTLLVLSDTSVERMAAIGYGRFSGRDDASWLAWIAAARTA